MKSKADMLRGKRILAVDDEPDVLDTLEEILSDASLVKAKSFEEAVGHLEREPFDMALLDIMGVNGYKLLETAVKKGVTAVMLTSHAFSPEDTMKSYKGGAAYYVPKDKMSDLPEILAQIFDAKKKGQSTWLPFMGWAEAYYEVKFGPRWEKRKQEFRQRIK
jgi:DNA-binding response OmpR family regulator